MTSCSLSARALARCALLEGISAAFEPSEWTLEAARKCWAPMIRPVQHVGAPGCPFQARILREETAPLGGCGASEQAPRVCQAIPRCWFRPGNRLAVEDMGTFFGGRIDLALEVARDGSSISARVSWRHMAARPAAVRLRLRSGDARPLRSVQVDGAPVAVGPDGAIELAWARNASFRVLGTF